MRQSRPMPSVRKRVRALSGWLAALACATSALAAEDALPERKADEPFDFEPSLQLTDVGQPADPVSGAAEAPIDVEKAKKALDRAKSKQERWQQLAKRGVLSKAEAETAQLQATRAASKYSQARVAQQKQEVESLRKRAASGTVSTDLLQAAESALATTIALAVESDASLKRTQVLLAESNLQRQRQLQSAGIGSRSQLRRAESLLQQLEVTAR